MGIDWAVIIDKAPEVVIVLAFSAFALKMLREFRIYIENQQLRWMKHTEDRDAIYLEKLEKIGNSQSAGIDTLSKDIQSQKSLLTAVMTKMCNQMETNDELLEFIAEDVKTRQIRGD